MPDDVIMIIPSQHRARLEALAYPALMTRTDAERAADDLAFVQSVRRAVENAKASTLESIRDRLDGLRRQYDQVLQTIAAAEGRVKDAIRAWRTREQADRTKAVERTITAEATVAAGEAYDDALAAGLSKTQASDIAAATGHAVVAQGSETIVPAPLPRAVQGEAGRASVRVDWVAEVVDERLIPREYLVVDEARIQRVVRALKGQVTIPGVRVDRRETIVGRSR